MLGHCDRVVSRKGEGGGKGGREGGREGRRSTKDRNEIGYKGEKKRRRKKKDREMSPGRRAPRAGRVG